MFAKFIMVLLSVKLCFQTIYGVYTGNIHRLYTGSKGLLMKLCVEKHIVQMIVASSERFNSDMSKSR